MSKVKKKNEIRRNLILRALLDHGQLSLSELKEKTGVTVPVVSSLVDSLIKENLIADAGTYIVNSAGRPPRIVKLNGQGGYIMGIDLGRVYSNFMLFDLEQKIVSQSRIKKIFLSNERSVIKKLEEQIKTFLNYSNIDWNDLIGIGISIPGIVDSLAGKSETYLNFEQQSIQNILEKHLNKQVYIEHDVKAMTLGEMWFGDAKNIKNALCIKIDWGLAVGIIIDGKIFYGDNSFSGEFGHISVKTKENKICYCGKQNCLETVASGRAIVEIVKERLKKGAVSLLNKMIEKDIQEIDASLILEAANKGDQFAIEVLEEACISLGQAIAILINIFNINHIILDGEIPAKAPTYILELIKTNALKHSLIHLNRYTEFTVSKLGHNAGAMGVAMLAARSLFEIELLNPSAYI